MCSSLKFSFRLSLHTSIYLFSCLSCVLPILLQNHNSTACSLSSLNIQKNPFSQLYVSIFEVNISADFFLVSILRWLSSQWIDVRKTFVFLRDYASQLAQLFHCSNTVLPTLVVAFTFVLFLFTIIRFFFFFAVYLQFIPSKRVVKNICHVIVIFSRNRNYYNVICEADIVDLFPVYFNTFGLLAN